MKTRKLFIPLLAAGTLVLSVAATGLISYLSHRVQDATAIPEASIQEINEAPTPVVQANECLTCHIEKQKLIDTAKPEEILVKESEGTG